jgi:hypothetical protein
LAYATGVIYDGEWKDDKQDWEAESTYTDGSIHEGLHKDDEQDGEGKRTDVQCGEVSELYHTYAVPSV